MRVAEEERELDRQQEALEATISEAHSPVAGLAEG
jgi:hypothetical protein